MAISHNVLEVAMPPPVPTAPPGILSAYYAGTMEGGGMVVKGEEEGEEGAVVFVPNAHGAFSSGYFFPTLVLIWHTPHSNLH